MHTEGRTTDGNIAARLADAIEARTFALQGVVQAGEDVELGRALWRRAVTYNRLAQSLANDVGRGAGETHSASRLARSGKPRGTAAREMDLF